MKNIQTRVLTIINVKELLLFFGLSFIIMGIPMFIHSQFITGPIVNAVLIIALYSLGIRSALLLGLVPSLLALSSGLLPVVLAPAVPFIMLSNTLFILVIDFINRVLKGLNISYMVAVITASLTKFVFLFLTSSILINLISNTQITEKVLYMMSWPQLVTALLGAVIAKLILNSLKKFKIANY